MNLLCAVCSVRLCDQWPRQNIVRLKMKIIKKAKAISVSLLLFRCIRMQFVLTIWIAFGVSAVSVNENRIISFFRKKAKKSPHKLTTNYSTEVRAQWYWLRAANAWMFRETVECYCWIVRQCASEFTQVHLPIANDKWAEKRKEMEESG